MPKKQLAQNNTPEVVEQQENGEIKFVNSLLELREEHTLGKPSHDIVVRKYKDEFDPKDPDQDCANSLYDFSYDEKKVAEVVKSFADEKRHLHETNHANSLAKIKSLEKSVELVNIDLKALESASKDDNEDILATAYKTNDEVAKSLVVVANQIFSVVLEDISDGVKTELEITNAVASVARESMPSAEKAFFPDYLKAKKLIEQIPLIQAKVDEASKGVVAAIEKKIQVGQAYCKTLLKRHPNDEDIARLKRSIEANDEIYRHNQLRKYYEVCATLQSEYEIVRTIVFLGKKNSTIEKKAHRLAVNRAKEVEFKSKLDANIALCELEYEKKKEVLDNQVAARKEKDAKELEALQAHTERWVSSVSKEDIAKLDAAFKSFEVVNLLEKEKKQLEDVEAVKTESIAKNEAIGKEIVVPERISFDEFNDLIAKTRESLKEQTKEKKLPKEVFGLTRGRLMAVWGVLNNKVEAQTGEYKKVQHAHVKLLEDQNYIVVNSAAKCEKVVREQNKHLVQKVLEVSGVAQAALYLSTKVELERLLVQKNENETAMYDFTRKTAERKMQSNVDAVKNKFDQKLDLILAKMEIYRVLIAIGRMLNNDKIINKNYAKLAKLQNKTKLVQKAYSEAVDGEENTYKNELVEIEFMHKKHVVTNEDRKYYLSCSLEKGPEFASKALKIRIKERHYEEKYRIKLESESVMNETRKESFVHTSKAWTNRCESDVNDLHERRQAIINKQYLYDAEAIRVRRFSLKYVPKRMFIRIFCIVAVCTTLGLINLIIRGPLMGFIVGVCLAIAVEVVKYFISPICYLMPKEEGLEVYNRQGELIFFLTNNDIVNAVMSNKRGALRFISCKLVGYQVLVESGADVFRFAIQDKSYKRHLDALNVAIDKKEAQKKKERYAEINAAEREKAHQARTNKANIVK